MMAYNQGRFIQVNTQLLTEIVKFKNNKLSLLFTTMHEPFIKRFTNIFSRIELQYYLSTLVCPFKSSSFHLVLGRLSPSQLLL